MDNNRFNNKANGGNNYGAGKQQGYNSRPNDNKGDIFRFKRKLIIRADLVVLTGMHIGTSNAYTGIGTVDSPVIRRGDSDDPIIPGSSLKGKLRSLLFSVINNEGTIRSLFGSTSSPSRLQFADAYVKSRPDGSITEVKFENTINRSSGIANPRQIERVVPGTVFEAVIVYNEYNNGGNAKDDLEKLARAMMLLQYDYLGGHGTRGYGRISFKNISVQNTDGRKDDISELAGLFKKVEEFELLDPFDPQ